MRRLSVALLAALAALSLGCAANRAASQPTAQIAVNGEADYDRLFDAALRVVGARFPIQAAERDAGTIKTEFLVGAPSMTGFKYDATREEAASELVRTVRRRADVAIDRGEAHTVTVRVEMEYLLREHAAVLPSGTFAYTTQRPYEDINPEATRWVSAGRDERLEAIIAREILAAYGK